MACFWQQTSTLYRHGSKIMIFTFFQKKFFDFFNKNIYKNQKTFFLFSKSKSLFLIYSNITLKFVDWILLNALKCTPFLNFVSKYQVFRAKIRFVWSIFFSKPLFKSTFNDGNLVKENLYFLSFYICCIHFKQLQKFWKHFYSNKPIHALEVRGGIRDKLFLKLKPLWVKKLFLIPYNLFFNNFDSK